MWQLIILVALLVGCTGNNSDNDLKDEDVKKTDPVVSVSVQSPDGDVEVNFSSEGQLFYEVSYKGKKLIAPSRLGFEFEGMEAMSKDFAIENNVIDKVNEQWEPVWGQTAVVDNIYTMVTFELVEKGSQGRTMNVTFKVYDDGVAFRYEIPEQDNVSEIAVSDELTEFNFTGDHTSWWIRNDWNSYEYLYNETPLSEARDVSTPFTMKTSDDIHISIHEAALVDYAGMALSRTSDYGFEAKLAPWPDGIKVKAEGSMITPWRTIQIGDDAGDLIESSLILNLNEPLAIEDTSWIQPMKYMGIWWEMHIDKSDWGQHNHNHGATTENAKYYIDFIGEHLTNEAGSDPIGLLVEGWNQGWDGNWMDNYDKFIFTVDGQYDDFDVEEVVAYGDQYNVEYIMHNETSGGVENYEAQMDAAYADYQTLGINAIKSGYVSDGGMRAPESVSHHGQYMVNHYNNAVIKAADYEIMINTHEPIKPTGLSRTYPNWVAREGVQGMEYNAWSEGNTPEHTTILPFTRILGGPIDYTPGIFDVDIHGGIHRVHTTRAKQLALYVVLYSPLQMITDLPENYLDENGEIYKEFEFVKNVPVDWSETVVVDAEIGDHVTIARQEKGGDKWYVGSITDEEARELKLSLDFLEEGQDYLAKVYTDGPGTDYLNDPSEVLSYEVLVDSDTVFHLSLPESGGAAMELIPAESSVGGSVQGYRYEDLKINELHTSKVIESNDPLVISLDVQNEATVMTSQIIEFSIDGQLIEEKLIRVAPEAVTEVEFQYLGLFEPGDYTVSVGAFENRTVTVKDKPATVIYSEPNIIVSGDNLIVVVQVTNTGTYETEETVNCRINGELMEAKTLTLGAGPGGVTKGVRFKTDIDGEGTYEIIINDSDVYLYP